jgi:hypothetical protein
VRKAAADAQALLTAAADTVRAGDRDPRLEHLCAGEGN